jgi:hypothetical protein
MILKINPSEEKRNKKILEKEKKKLGLESKVINLMHLSWDEDNNIPVYKSKKEKILSGYTNKYVYRSPAVLKIEYLNSTEEYFITLPLEKIVHEDLNRIIKHELYHIYAEHLNKKNSLLRNILDDIPAELYANFGIKLD